MPLEMLQGLFDRPGWASAADGLGLALLVVYHLFLWRVFRHCPERTYRGRTNRLRRAWVETVRANGNDILAIQTLRNWVMSATLFASTAIVVGLGIVSVAFEGLDMGALSQTLSLSPTGAALVQVKLLLLAAFFFSAFLQFALSLRYYNHTGFLINLPSEHFNGTEVDLIADTLNRAGGHYHQGTRTFLLAIPFVLWLIGPEWFFGGVVVSLLLLYRFDFRLDRQPAPTAPPAAFEVGDPHALLPDEVLQALHSQHDGLRTAEAA